MTSEREELIRRRAHEIWEREGRPHGRHEDHWQQAFRELGLDAEEVSSFESMEGAPSDPAQAAPAKTRKRRNGAAAGDKPGADGQSTAPKRRAAGRAEAAPAEAEADGAQASTEPASRRRMPKAAAAGEGADQPKLRRARKPKAESDGPVQS